MAAQLYSGARGLSIYVYMGHNCSPPCDVAVQNSAYPFFQKYCCKTIEARILKKYQIKAN